MSWRFTILTRNQTAVEIDEPPGFDQTVANISRDAESHGIFFSITGETFEYYNQAMLLIKAENDEYGLEGKMSLLIEENCGSGYVEALRGRFDFNKYEFHCESSCFVKIPVEKTGETMQFRNRINQKVNLESLKAFDQTTDLPAYAALPLTLSLPSKGIFMQNAAAWKEETITGVSLSEVPKIITNSDGRESFNWAFFQIIPPFENTTFSEFGEFGTTPTPEHNFILSGLYPATIDPNFELVVKGNTPPDNRKVYFDWVSATPLLYNDKNRNGFDAVASFNLSINYSFELQLLNAGIAALYNVVCIRRENGSFEYLHKQRIVSAVAGSGIGGMNSGSVWLKGTTQVVSFSAVDTAISLKDGEYLFTVVCGLAFYSNKDAKNNLDAYKISSLGGTVKLDTLSHFPPTDSKVFAVNEAWSRITESITNNQLKAYSEYFGRIDSQPYATAVDGCGSLEVITDGIRIRRQENKTPGSTSVFSASIQDLLDGLSPIHNLGMGIEADPNRLGFNRLRVEQWHHFYKDDVIMNCIGVSNLVKKSNDKRAFSTFQIGYSKWEAEEYNGLDEILTKRIFRTTLEQLKNDLVKLSTLIGSGYALEVTRRKGNETSKDWRYDKNFFIICCERNKTKYLTTFKNDGWIIDVPAGQMDAALQVFKVGVSIQVSGLLNSGTYVINTVNAVAGGLRIYAAGTFLLTIGQYGFSGGTGWAVELGNVINAQNIIDPATLYNYRITPLRNALRWINRIFSSYRKFNDSNQIVFTDGEGNYFARGEMQSLICKLEAGILSENQTIDRNTFKDLTDAHPVFKAEDITYDYPISSAEYKHIQANPYGKIYYKSDCEEGFGYIDDVAYKMSEGIATFTLIPKYDD